MCRLIFAAGKEVRSAKGYNKILPQIEGRFQNLYRHMKKFSTERFARCFAFGMAAFL